MASRTWLLAGAVSLSLGAVLPACGSGGTGGVPTGSSGLGNGSGNPANGSGNPADGSGLPFDGSGGPSNGSGNPANGNPANTNPATPTCTQTCAKLAACGANQSACETGCPAVSSDCLLCIAAQPCATVVSACTDVCQVSSGAGGSGGAGGASSGSGGKHGGSAGSTSSGGDCGAIATHLKNDCMYPDTTITSFDQSCAQLPAACLACFAGDCAAIGTCAMASCQ